MLIYNINFQKLKKNFFKIIIPFIIIIIIVLFIFALSKFITKANNSTSQTIEPTEILDSAFSNFLQDIHNNIDSYLGNHYKIIGFVYRMPDFTEKQFVLARKMIINNNDTNNAVIVGLLCESPEIINFENNAWIECTGEIIKGDYKGSMPVLKINKIDRISKPENEYINSPTVF